MHAQGSKEHRNGVSSPCPRRRPDVGLAILKKGGNAVDADAATALAMAVTHPSAGNIGGGGFMVIHLPGKGEPTVIDFRETAPGAATKDMFKKDEERLWPSGVGVPGTGRGS